MSVDPVAAQLGQQAQSVGGTDVAGIYGDQAGASQQTAPQSDAQVASQLAAQGAQPAQVDTAALLARLQQLEANQAAAAQAHAEANPEPKPPTLLEIASGLPAAVAHAFQAVEDRLAKLEGR